MNSNKKLLLIVAVMLLILMIATVVNVAVNFRNYSYKSTLERANATAEYVRDGLTAYMVNGIMDKREFFLNNIKNHKNIKDFWIIRSQNVKKQFGPGYQNENIRDEIDKEVLKTGKLKYKINETSDNITLRVTIPYIATAYGNPNCLKCHNAKEGDVLGAISMEFDIKEIRYSGIITILKIIAINIVFLIIALVAINHFFKPIMNLFNELSNMIKLAYKGDYSKRIDLNISGGEGQELVKQINNLFDKLQSTFGDLKHSLSTFVTTAKISTNDPIEESKIIIHKLSDIYKFKKTIELDKSYYDIFERLFLVLKEKFNIKHFAFYLIHKKNDKRELIYITDNEKSFCDEGVDEDVRLCRAFRTGNEVDSEDFEKICKFCNASKDIKYICLPFDISDELSLVISMSTKDIKKYEEIKENIYDILSYLDSAKPILESKFLMQKLEESSLKDGLTGLYNRRFLENFIEKFANQVDRAQKHYAILMIDIDHFKMVNDTYGHDIGDKVIKELSKVLQNSIRSSDLAIRYGGEEFLVLLYNPDIENVTNIANKISTNFKKIEFKANNEKFTKTLSIGISLFPKQADSIWQAIKYADIALYEAKHSGRDKIVEFSDDLIKDDKY
jgi:diguanylate cyclase (GGDEF)-like protein